MGRTDPLALGGILVLLTGFRFPVSTFADGAIVWPRFTTFSSRSSFLTWFGLRPRAKHTARRCARLPATTVNDTDRRLRPRPRESALRLARRDGSRSIQIGSTRATIRTAGSRTNHHVGVTFLAVLSLYVFGGEVAVVDSAVLTMNQSGNRSTRPPTQRSFKSRRPLPSS
jgi:hypothetical protein